MKGHEENMIQGNKTEKRRTKQVNENSQYNTTKRKDDWRYEYDNRQRDRKKINTKRDRYKDLEKL